MKKKFIGIFFVAGLLSLAGCYKDDLADLQKQVDELEQKVAQDLEAIKSDLLSQIDDLQASLTNLEQENSAAFADLQASLDSISTDVANNAKSVFYGNLITDEDYAAYVEAGANVVTGEVVISKPEHVEIVKNLRWVGADLVTEFGSIAGVQNVGGNVIVNSADTVINLAGMLTIGGNFDIPLNADLVSITADDLIVISGELSLVEGIISLKTISMPSLEVVGSIYMNGENTSTTEGKIFVTLDWNSPNVDQDLTIENLAGPDASFGDVMGNIFMEYCDFAVINFEGTKLGGDFVYKSNTTSLVNAKSVVSIDGMVEITNNNATGGAGPVAVQPGTDGLQALVFDALKTIGGDVTIIDNKSLFDIFNSVETVNGDVLYHLRDKTAVVIAFESLLAADNIVLGEDMQLQSMTGFNNVTTAKSITIGENYAIIETADIFNSIADLGSYSVNIGLYANTYPALDLSNSFKALKSVYKVNVYGYSYKSWTGDMIYKQSEFAAGAFPALLSSNTINFDGKITYNEGFASLDSTYNVILNNGITSISLPALTKIGSTLKVYMRNANDNVQLSFPKLVSARYIYLNGYEAGATISIDMPEVTSLEKFYFYDYNYSGGAAPVSMIAAMPKLKGISTLDLNFKNASTPVDMTNFMTGLTDLTGTYPRVKLQYQTGQTFCGISTFLNNLVTNNLLTKVYLYKDGVSVPSADEATEIQTNLTGTCAP